MRFSRPVMEKRMTDPSKFVQEHVALFNMGVRTGDFGPMLSGFTEDAELSFHGVPAGPYRGKTAIAAAYQQQPPDDEIDVLGTETNGDEIVARYAWRAEPARRGRMIFTVEGDRIAGLLVTFDQEPPAPPPADPPG